MVYLGGVFLFYYVCKETRMTSINKETRITSEKVMTLRGEAVAIGEFKIRNSEEFPYEVPRLSYIIIHDSKTTYVSTCIDLHIDGDGGTPEEAEANMGKNVFEFLCANFAKNRSKGRAWDFLKELMTINDNSKQLWNAYSYCKIELGRGGLKTDLASDLIDRVTVLKSEIERLTKLDTNKQNTIRQLLAWLSKQKKEIDRLNEEKQMISKEKSKEIVILQPLGKHESWNCVSAFIQ